MVATTATPETVPTKPGGDDKKVPTPETVPTKAGDKAASSTETASVSPIQGASRVASTPGIAATGVDTFEPKKGGVTGVGTGVEGEGESSTETSNTILADMKKVLDEQVIAQNLTKGFIKSLVENGITIKS